MPISEVIYALAGGRDRSLLLLPRSTTDEDVDG